MADYSLVVNSQFTPFSYQEMLAPVMMATQAQQELENQYGEFSAKANIWDNIANEQTDPYAYKMYKTYANDLATKADLLAREGLTPTSRRDLLNMRARYSKEITPIEQAYATRQKQAEQQQQALLQDPTIMLSRRASTTSLDDYIRNPQLAYDTYSGKLITAQAAQAASALAKEIRNNPRKWRSILGNSYYETMMQRGFSSDAVLKAIQNSPTAAPELQRIVEDTVNSSGVKNWGDKITINRAYDYARQGLWNAVGETQYQNLDNWKAKMAAQEAIQVRAEQRAAIQNQPNINNLAINPLNIYSSRELSEQEKQYKRNFNNFSKYFYKDAQGNMKMTRAGWDEYRKKLSSISQRGSTAAIQSVGNRAIGMGGVPGTGNSGPEIRNDGRTPFRIFMDNLGAMKRTKGRFNPTELGALWNNYINQSSSKSAVFDATKVTEYDYAIASSQQSDLKNAILTASRGKKLDEVEYDSKNKTFKVTGNTLSLEDLKDNNYKVTNTRFSPYGSTVMIQDDKGKVKRYRLPAGINIINENNRDRAMQAAIQWQQVVNTGQYTDAKGKKHQATPDEITYAQQQFSQAIQQAYMFHSQLGVSNKTKEQEFNYYGY